MVWIRRCSVVLVALGLVGGSACSEGPDRVVPRSASTAASSSPGSAPSAEKIAAFVAVVLESPRSVIFDSVVPRTVEELKGRAQLGTVVGVVRSARVGAPRPVPLPPGAETLPFKVEDFFYIDVLLEIEVVEENLSGPASGSSRVTVGVGGVWSGPRSRLKSGERAVQKAVDAAPIGVRMIDAIGNTWNDGSRTVLLGYLFFETPGVRVTAQSGSTASGVTGFGEERLFEGMSFDAVSSTLLAG